MLWMLSNSDFTSPFWFQDSGACTGSLTWLNATGAHSSCIQNSSSLVFFGSLDQAAIIWRPVFLAIFALNQVKCVITLW